MDNYEAVDCKYKWNNKRKGDFIHLLQQNIVGDQLAALNSDISTCNSSNEVESCVSEFVCIIDTVSAPLFQKKVHSQDVSEPDCSSFTYKNDAP